MIERRKDRPIEEEAVVAQSGIRKRAGDRAAVIDPEGSNRKEWPGRVDCLESEADRLGCQCHGHQKNEGAKNSNDKLTHDLSPTQHQRQFIIAVLSTLILLMAMTLAAQAI